MGLQDKKNQKYFDGILVLFVHIQYTCLFLSDMFLKENITENIRNKKATV